MMKLTQLAVFVLALSLSVDQVAAVEFTTEIKPILEANCLRCHNDNNAKGDLSLSSFASANAFGAELFRRDQPEDSLLLAVITSADGEPPEMPKESTPLSTEERQRLQSWLSQRSPWPENVTLQEPAKADESWWAYQALDHDSTQPKTIDDFIDAKLNEAGLKRRPMADRRTLIRRATYDLTGLPPSPEEVHVFVADPDPRAYERLIERLLASPHYGERWGRHWLDVTRFGESLGYERNVIVNDLWPFRDYVIDSINADKPFDQFIREHIAGDVISPDKPEVVIGSAFLVAGPWDDVGNQDAVQAAQIRANTLDEIIRASSEAFLGLTVGCARCHNHKFDPIQQSDYYQLYATFAGIRHGSRPWATPAQKQARADRLAPLQQNKDKFEEAIRIHEAAILKRAELDNTRYEAAWTRPPSSRTGTEERFGPLTAKYIRLVSEGQDRNPKNRSNFNIDEFEVWSTDTPPINVALATNGAKAHGSSRTIEDFADAYNAQLAIDGEFGARYIATGGNLTIELPSQTSIDRVFFSSARTEPVPDLGKFTFVGEYRIEVSTDGKDWTKVADSSDRQPTNDELRKHRLLNLAATAEDQAELKRLRSELSSVNREIRSIPALPTAYIGDRKASDGMGPYHVFQGGNPQRKGSPIVPASLTTLRNLVPNYQLSEEAPEHRRRLALAEWITNSANALTLRVLANRIWHYHFGTGIVDTPSDFGYMGGRPSHPELLDYLANKLRDNGWRLKPLHKEIMLSATYQQASTWSREAVEKDGHSRLLWRFPPRRLSAEEIRDTMLHVTGSLHVKMGGPGFRLYKFMQDNVSTYDPLDEHPSSTYRRAVYHQNARASVVDLMTDFDLPDCAFSTPRRAQTTSPLQALTLLNHSFTLDMADALAERLKPLASSEKQIESAFQLVFQRPATPTEAKASTAIIEKHGLSALCRALFNTNELIYLD
jgi:hypothetical protein